MNDSSKVKKFPIQNIDQNPHDYSARFKNVSNYGYNIDNRNTYEKEEYEMDNTALNKYIEKMENDSREFRQEMRERDQRAEERLQRMEARIEVSQKASEERLNQSQRELEKRFDKSVDEMKNVLYDTRNHVQEIEKQNRQFNIANLIAIIGLIIAFLIGVVQINQGFVSIIESMAK